MRRFLAGLALVALSASACNSVSSSGSILVGNAGPNGYSYSIADRKTITELSGPELGGTQTLSTTQFKGQVVVLNFWGSWCGPCRTESADLEAAYTATKAQGVQFLGINVRETSQDAGIGYEKAKQITYPSIYDPGMRTMLALRGVPSSAIPTTVVLDRSGKVAHVWLGGVTQSQVTDVVSAVAAEH